MPPKLSTFLVSCKFLFQLPKYHHQLGTKHPHTILWRTCRVKQRHIILLYHGFVSCLRGMLCDLWWSQAPGSLASASGLLRVKMPAFIHGLDHILCFSALFLTYYKNLVIWLENLVHLYVITIKVVLRYWQCIFCKFYLLLSLIPFIIAFFCSWLIF